MEKNNFIREIRYAVIKYKDIESYLTLAEQSILRTLLTKVSVERKKEGKEILSAVVVEYDWPEYEEVWKMIEKRVTNE